MNSNQSRVKRFHVMNMNLSVRGLQPSATLAINERSAELIRAGRTIYKLGLGQSPFPVPQPVVQALREHAHEKDYLAVQGLYELREVVAKYLQQYSAFSYKAEDILVGPGSKELMFLVQLVYYGDLVIPAPSWVSYAPQARILGRNVHWLPTLPENSWKLMPDEMEKLCKGDPSRPRILILNEPNKPCGMTYSAGELRAMAKIARKYRVILLSDEIYGELHHQNNQVSSAQFYPEGTIISTGLSKWCGAGGWRLGLFAFPEELHWLRDGMAAVASETFTSTSAPIQYAAVRAFEGGDEIDNYLRQSRRVLRSLGTFCAKRLQAAKINVDVPEGAFYLFPGFPFYEDGLKKLGIDSNKKFCEKLLEDTGVAVLPGSSFGRPDLERTFRLAYVDFDGAATLAAAGEIPDNEEIPVAFLRKNCGKVTTAIDLICDWVNALPDA